MMRIVGRLFILLLVAGVLSGAVYAVSQSAMAQSMTPANRHDNEKETDHAEWNDEQEYNEANGDRDASLSEAVPGMAAHTLFIAVVTLIVAGIQTMTKHKQRKQPTTSLPS